MMLLLVAGGSSGAGHHHSRTSRAGATRDYSSLTPPIRLLSVAPTREGEEGEGGAGGVKKRAVREGAPATEHRSAAVQTEDDAAPPLLASRDSRGAQQADASLSPIFSVVSSALGPPPPLQQRQAGPADAAVDPLVHVDSSVIWAAPRKRPPLLFCIRVSIVASRDLPRGGSASLGVSASRCALSLGGQRAATSLCVTRAQPEWAHAPPAAFRVFDLSQQMCIRVSAPPIPHATHAQRAHHRFTCSGTGVQRFLVCPLETSSCGAWRRCPPRERAARGADAKRGGDFCRRRLTLPGPQVLASRTCGGQVAGKPAASTGSTQEAGGSALDGGADQEEVPPTRSSFDRVLARTRGRFFLSAYS